MAFVDSAVAQEREHYALVLGEIGLVRSLGEMNIPLFVGSETRENISIHSRYVKQSYIFSKYDTIEFINELCELGQYFSKKPVIFSDDDRALLNISQNRERLEKYYLFLYPERDMVNNILDKERFSELAEKHNLPVPDSYRLNSVNDFSAVASHVKFPCIIKPIQRHFWWGEEFRRVVGFYKKAIKCRDFEELETVHQKISQINPGVILQEYIEGGDDRHYSANLFVDSHGDLQGHFIARKKRIYPITAGTGTYVETLDNEEVLEASLNVIEKLELKGLINVQFKQDSRTGDYNLLEIHARNSLWSLLGAKAGANLAHRYFRYLVDGRLDDKPVKAVPKVKYFNLPKDLRALRDYQAEGVLTFGEWLNSLKGDKVFAVLSTKDLMPFLFLLWFFASTRMKFHVNKKKPQSDWNLKNLVRPVNFLTRMF